jgi:hypothetical protein
VWGVFGCEKYIQKIYLYVDLSVVVRIILILNLKIRSVRMLTGFNCFRVYEHGVERLVSVRGLGLLVELRNCQLVK